MPFGNIFTVCLVERKWNEKLSYDFGSDVSIYKLQYSRTNNNDNKNLLNLKLFQTFAIYSCRKKNLRIFLFIQILLVNIYIYI